MPQLPYVLYILDLGTTYNKYIPVLLTQGTNIKQVQENRSKHLNDDTCITSGTVTKGFKNIKTIAPSVYQYFNNFKLLHRRTVHNKLLFKMGISETHNCLFCKTETETIEHIYIECDKVKILWKVTARLG